ncbi:MAG TPA: general secretion pathway protein GspB [Geobacteraceae bacterium]
MSSILKALKKLEAEKAARHGEPVDIAREVARGESAASPSHRRVPVMTVALALLVGAVIAITAALLLWPRGGVTPANEAKPAATTPAPVQTQQEFSLPTPGQAITQPTEQQVTITMPPASRPAQPAPLPLPVPAPGTVTSPPKESQPPTTAPAASQPTPQQSQPALRPLPGEPELKANIPAVTEPGHSKLVVSGIAWQKDSADRLAIINGHPVRIGTTIDGAVVEEILPDRVRFSRNKQPFEVLWGAK